MPIDINGPCPDRETNFRAWEQYIYARALERSWREKANGGATSPAFGGATPAPRPTWEA